MGLMLNMSRMFAAVKVDRADILSPNSFVPTGLNGGKSDGVNDVKLDNFDDDDDDDDGDGDDAVVECSCCGGVLGAMHGCVVW